MDIQRRQLLGTGLALGASALPASSATASAFAHGVASGDPHADSLLLWTRVSGSPEDQPVEVQWQVSTRPDFQRLVAQGRQSTDASRDFTLKVVAQGLQPGTDYWYRFRSAGQHSPVGRARTLPRGRLDTLNLVVACCAVYLRGNFEAYAEMARQPELDAVLFLGDYIYEYGMTNLTAEHLLRVPDPTHDAVTLDDYRRRYAQWRSDPSLQAAHARAAWICMWDDHELANDDWTGGAQNHDPARSGPWEARKAAAVRAYLEWMPIRDAAAGRQPYDVERSFSFGDLATLIVPETRLKARDEQLSLRRDIAWRLVDVSDPGKPQPVTDPALLALPGTALPAHIKRVPDVADFKRKLEDPKRRMLGDEQFRWVESEMRGAVKQGQPWVLFASETVMASTVCPDLTPWVNAPGRVRKVSRIKGLDGLLNSLYELSRFGLPMLGLDSWDGYRAERRRLYELIERSGARTVVLSGDSHMAWINELHHEDRRVALELSSSTLTGPTFAELIQIEDVPFGQLIAENNRDVIWSDALAVGYIRLQLTPQRVHAEFVSVEQPRASKSAIRTVKRVEATAQAKGSSSGWREI